MAIYKQNIVDIDLGRGQIHRSFLNHSIGMYDQQADRFGIRVLRDGEAVDLTGITVQGVFMPPQGSPIAITGNDYTSVEGNTAEVILPQACYNYEGNFTLAIKLVDATNTVTGTMRIVDGVVDNTHASGTVAPTGSVPTYQEVLAVYADMVTALVTVDELDDEVSDFKGAFLPDITDLFSAQAQFSNLTHRGITYSWDATNSVCHLSGTATGSSHQALINSPDSLPDFIQAGKNILILISGLPTGAYLHLYLYPNTLPNRDISITRNTILSLPESCTGVLFRMDVNTGTEIQSGGVDVSVKVYCNYDNLSSFRELTHDEAIAIPSFESVSKRFHCSMKGSEIKTIDPNFPFALSNNVQYCINAYPYTLSAEPLSSGIIEIIRGSGAQRYIGYKVGSSNSIVWNDISPKEPKNRKAINILFIGNSFTEDENDYLPALLKEALPDLDFVIGILYKGGASLEEQWEQYTNQTTYARYSEYKNTSTSWSITTNSITMQQAVAKNPWDVITFQQASSDGTAYSTYQPYLNNLINALQADIGKNVRFVIILYHAYADGYTATGYDGDSDAQYAAISAAVQEAYAKTAVSEVIPTGTAVQNARTTTLDSLGTFGHLSYDGMHLQEGIPCLIPAYVTFLKVCEWIGYKEIGVLGSVVLPTAEWVSAQSIPGQNGSSVGATAANKLIAAKCAIAAIKNPYTITDCSGM